MNSKAWLSCRLAEAIRIGPEVLLGGDYIAEELISYFGSLLTTESSPS